MKKVVPVLFLCLKLGLSCAWATSTTNPGDFQDFVNWCTNYGCGGQQLGSPQAWTSGGGRTGLVGLVSSQNMENLQQGSSWYGNFNNGMGLIYNGVTTLGNTPGGILLSFNQLAFGVGAYIQPDFYGPFTATIQLFDSSFNLLETFTANGTSDTNSGTALFIGAYEDTADVAYALFDTSGIRNDDFAIGDLGIRTAVPEPGTLALLGSSLLGLAGAVRRRMSHKEVR